MLRTLRSQTPSQVRPQLSRPLSGTDTALNPCRCPHYTRRLCTRRLCTRLRHGAQRHGAAALTRRRAERPMIRVIVPPAPPRPACVRPCLLRYNDGNPATHERSFPQAHVRSSGVSRHGRVHPRIVLVSSRSAPSPRHSKPARPSRLRVAGGLISPTRLLQSLGRNFDSDSDLPRREVDENRDSPGAAAITPPPC